MPARMDKSHVDAVRRCRRCGDATAIVVHDWGPVRFLGVEVARLSRLDFRCQKCGYAFVIRPWSRLHTAFAVLLSPPACLVSLLFVAAGVVMWTENAALAAVVIAGAGSLQVFYVVSAWHGFVQLRSKARNPVVRGVAAPSIVFPGTWPMRLCRCGAPSGVTALKENHVNRIPVGTVSTHTCPRCHTAFRVPSRGTILSYALLTSVVMSFLVLLVVDSPGTGPFPEPGSLILVSLVGLAAMGCWVVLLAGLLARHRHSLTTLLEPFRSH